MRPLVGLVLLTLSLCAPRAAARSIEAPAARPAASRLPQHLRAARERIAAGRQLLAQVELERAARSFAEAERLAREQMDLPEAPALIGEALRWQGVALFEQGRERAAQDLFQRALLIDPTGRLTTAEVRPHVVAAFRRAERRMPPPPAAVEPAAPQALPLPPPAPPRPPPVERPLHRRAWPYLAGAGALVLVSGVVLGLTLGLRSAPQGTVVVDPGRFALTF